MQTRRTFLFLGTSLSLTFLFPGFAMANKASVSIEAPAEVAKGSEITVRLNIDHNANSLFHHVEWVKVWINGEELARWEYSAFSLPEDATFIKEIKYTVNRPIEIRAEASCNIHGSKGPAAMKVSVKE